MVVALQRVAIGAGKAHDIVALDEVTRNYGASVVLCTATQPALRKEDGCEDGCADVRELAPEPLALRAS